MTIDGFTARNYKANGFFVVNAVGYTLTHLVAAKSGVYGLYAFNSKGGEMSHSEAYYHSDAGFYIGQTPQQAKPIRSVVRDVESWGNPIGFSATNMRYVTITGSRFYNNAIGIVPNALESEKFPPAEANVITDNDIFWNNFNIHAGAPFKPKTTGVVPLVPVGTGILLLGGRTNRVEDNRIYGNYLVGVAAIEGILLDKTTEARALIGNQIAATRSAPAARTSTAATSPSTATAATTAGARTPAWRPRCRPTPRCSRPARSPAPTRSARTRRTSSRLRGRQRAQGLDQAPAQGQARLHAAGGLREVRLAPVLAIAGAALVAAPATAAAPKPRTVKIADNYYLPAKLDDQAAHEGRLALARRGRRRPRRQAQVGAQGRAQVPVPAGLRRLHVQAHAGEARALQDRLHAPRGDDDDDHRAPLARCRPGRAVRSRPWRG